MTQICNQTRNTLIADHVEVARSVVARIIGLMGRKTLPAGFAMVFYPDSSIHTLFMRILIDVVFVDANYTVVGLRHEMSPWRLYAGVSPREGRYVIELPAGVLKATGTEVGDQLSVDLALA